MNPGDIIGVCHGNSERLYRVTAVMLGGLGEDSVYEMVCLDRQHNTNTKAGKLVVPVSLIDTGVSSGVFTHFSESEVQP